MEKGLIEANLGGDVVKKRLALPGRGKRGGARTLVATNKDNRWFFLFGFRKNERANITSEELEGLREITRQREHYQFVKAYPRGNGDLG